MDNDSRESAEEKDNRGPARLHVGHPDIQKFLRQSHPGING